MLDTDWTQPCWNGYGSSDLPPSPTRSRAAREAPHRITVGSEDWASIAALLGVWNDRNLALEEQRVAIDEALDARRLAARRLSPFVGSLTPEAEAAARLARSSGGVLAATRRALVSVIDMERCLHEMLLAAGILTNPDARDPIEQLRARVSEPLEPGDEPIEDPLEDGADVDEAAPARS